MFPFYGLCLFVTLVSSAVLGDLKAVGWPGEGSQSCQRKGSRNTRHLKATRVKWRVHSVSVSRALGWRAGCTLWSLLRLSGGLLSLRGSDRRGVRLGWGRALELGGPEVDPHLSFSSSLLGEMPPVFSFSYVLGSQRTIFEVL